jgi:protein required for attachment to host cells
LWEPVSVTGQPRAEGTRPEAALLRLDVPQNASIGLCYAVVTIHTRRGIQMSQLRIPPDAMVFVGDGRKALFLRNTGDDVRPTLTVEQVVVGPGRVYGGTSANTRGRRAGVGQTDWHQAEEQHFARHMASILERLVRSHSVHALIIVAPARTLAELREAFHPDVRKAIVAELPKDLPKHPTYEIEQLLTHL